MRSKRPCKNHSIAIPDWTLPEVYGMYKHGVRFTECDRCKWIIVV